MTPFARIRAYTAHPDPATRTANFVALLIGWNGPFYPLYVIGLVGTAGMALLPLTMASTPFFLAVPALSRRSSTAARLAVPLLGTLNTLWCMKLLGPGSGVGIFLLPCIALAALLHRRGEQPLLLLATLLPLAAFFVPDAIFATPLTEFTPAQARRLAALNDGSVAALTAVLALRFAELLRRLKTD